MKNTPLVTSVLSVLEDIGKPLTVPAIIELLAEKGLSPNKTTLYRMMDRLIEEGKVRSLLIDSKTLHFELTTDHEHHHFSCQKCDQVFCIEDANVESSLHELERKLGFHGFSIDECHFSLNGVCAKCH